MLHATRLGLTHPVTGDTMTWESPIPADMKRLIARQADAAKKDDEDEEDFDADPEDSAEMWD